MLLVAASLIIVTVVVVKVWMTMFELTIYMEPADMLSDPFGLTHRVMEADAALLGPLGYVFLAVWVYGVVDALAARAG